MPVVEIIKPTDQPKDNRRLLKELRSNLQRDDLNEFKFITAYAKSGPMVRLEEYVDAWRCRGGSVKAVFGVDQKGTSREVLEFAIRSFDESFVAHTFGTFTPTFHPKLYFFAGGRKAVAYVGSNNLTVGGTETNYEVYVKIKLELPAESQTLNDLRACWEDAKRIALPLDEDLVQRLVADDLVASEEQLRRSASDPLSGRKKSSSSSLSFPVIDQKPHSPVPKDAFSQPSSPSTSGATSQASTSIGSVTSTALVIQVKPRKNGEIHLSKTAVDQNKNFFDWPFSGQTTPKKSSNPSYPQRTPPPVVDIALYDSNGNKVTQHSGFKLTTVYYKPRSEIRITVPQNIIGPTVRYTAPKYCTMVMAEASPQAAHEYDIDIYEPGSSQYRDYLAKCNQQMPSGGKPHPRRFGWL
jgi:HKD family nuclease